MGAPEGSLGADHGVSRNIEDVIRDVSPRIGLILKDFSNESAPPRGIRYDHFDLSPEDFPVPELVLFVLRDLFGCKSLGPGEKVRWTVSCSFQGKALVFSLQKFGFRAFVQADTTDVDRRTALNRLKKAVAFAERSLERLSLAAVHSNDVGLANRFGQFDSRYRFFREEARSHFAAAKQPNKNESSTILAEAIGNFMMHERSGSFLSAAMIDAYFSRLEHLSILMLPLIGFDRSDGNLMRLIRSDWDPKYRAVCDINADKKAKILYDGLLQVKERYRNPLAHGGFEKGWWSLFFLLPKIGVVPGNLTGIAQSIQFEFLPIDSRVHARVCRLFDRVDQHFEATKRRTYALQYIKCGLDVLFDKESEARYQSAMMSRARWIDFLQRECHLSDMHVNMDY